MVKPLRNATPSIIALLMLISCRETSGEPSDNLDSVSGTSSDSGIDTNSDTNTDTLAGTDSDTETGSDTNTETDSETETMTDAERVPRLFVADKSGIYVWDRVDEIVEDRAPDMKLLGSDEGGEGLAILENWLFVASDGSEPVRVYDQIDTITQDVAATLVLEAIRFPMDEVFKDFVSMHTDTTRNLWIGALFNDIYLFPEIAVINTYFRYKKVFIGPNRKISDFAHDELGKKLIGGEFDGSGIVVFDDPLQASFLNHHDWTLDPNTSSWTMKIHSDQLFAGHADYVLNEHRIHIWNQISLVESKKAPDVVLDSAIDAPVYDLFSRGDTMVVTLSNKVLIFENASKIADDTDADLVIVDDALREAKKSILDAEDNLYVLTQTNVLILASATTKPVLKAKLTTQPVRFKDMMLLESR